MKTLKELVDYAYSRQEYYENDTDRFIVIKCANENVKELLKENLVKLGVIGEGGMYPFATYPYIFIRYGENSFFDMNNTFKPGLYGKEYLTEEILWLA